MGSIVLYMYTSEKTDRIFWQVTNTKGVPILGRTQAKLMNYVIYPDVHTPKNQEQSPVSVDSLKSTDYVYSLETTNSSLQSKRLPSLWTVLILHPQPTRLPKKSTELQPEQNQAQHMDLSFHKSLGAGI